MQGQTDEIVVTRLRFRTGSLVDVPGAINARFPPFTTREADPLSYCEEAPDWPVAEIPISARDHQDLLLELMAGPPVDRTGNGYEPRN